MYLLERNRKEEINDNIESLNSIDNVTYSNETTLSSSASTTPSPPQTPQNENLDFPTNKMEVSIDQINKISMPKPSYSNKIEMLIGPESPHQEDEKSSFDNTFDSNDEGSNEENEK